jgi:hypothetical protein
MTPGGNYNCYDVAFQPGSSTNLYATFRGSYFFRSTNLGTNWTQNTAGLPASGVERSELGVSANNPLCVYILYGNASDGSIYGIYRSTDGGLTFSEQNGSNLSSLMFDGQEG